MRRSRFETLALFLRQCDPAPWPWPAFATALFGSIVIYLGVFLPAFLWLPHHAPPPEFVDLTTFMGGDYRGLATWVVMVSALFVLWAVMLRSARGLSPGKGAFIFILLASAVCHTTLLLTFPATNSDVLHYVADARLIWDYGANPLVVAPDAFAVPVLTPNVWWWQASPYGPLSQIIGLGSLALAFNQTAATLIVFKATAVAFSVGTGALVYLAVLRQSPEHAPFAATFVALNPLTVLLVGIGGQNDAAMMFFTTLGLLLLLQRQWLWAPTALAGGALIKLSALLFLPIALLYTIRKAGLIPAVVGFGIAGVIALLIYAPFYEGPETFNVIRWQSQQFTSSVATLLVLNLRDQLGEESAIDLARLATAVPFAAAAAFIVVRWWRRGADTFPEAMAWLILAYLAIGATWWQPWYLLWLMVPVAMTRGHGFLTVVTAVYCWSGMMNYGLLFGWYLWWVNPGAEVETLGQTLQVLTIYLPLLLVSLGAFGVWLVRRPAGVVDTSAPIPEEARRQR